MDQSSTFELSPAERQNIPRLAEIETVACLSDNAFRLSFPTPTDFTKQVIELLEDQVGDPIWRHIKVVEKETGVLAAWASWKTPTDAQIREQDEKSAAEVEQTQPGSGMGGFDPDAGFLTYVQVVSDRWMKKWTRGKRHIICKALYTEPSFQRQGMGTALVKYGNQLADQKSLPIFVHAMPFGHPIYAKQGFETVQRLDVDLTRFAKSNDKGYGNYRLRYMLRLPQML